jgi:acyl-CoA thioesterase II
MGDLARDTHVRGSDGTYTATLSPDWNIWGPCGGYIAAVGLRAAGAHTEFRRPVSFTCHFLGVGQYRDVDITTRTLRKTKRAESVAVTITQDGNPLLEAVAWAIGDVGGIAHEHTAFPDVPKHTELKDIRELLTAEELAEGPPMNFWSNFDERPIQWLSREEWGKRPGGDPVWRHWVRFHPTPSFDDPFVEAGRLLCLLDVSMWPSAARAYDQGSLAYIAPSLDLSAVFHQVDDVSDWLLLDGHSPVARDGIVGGTGRVWSEDGTLLCSGVQSMLCRPAQRP